jgi:hypothetical protein
MRPSHFQRAPVIAVCTLVLGWAIHIQGQTLPTTPPRASAPADPSPSSKPAPPDDLQWNSVGATAQCRDGTFFRGKVDANSCAEHGGVRKLLDGRGQDLIR